MSLKKTTLWVVFFAGAVVVSSCKSCFYIFAASIPLLLRLRFVLYFTFLTKSAIVYAIARGEVEMPRSNAFLSLPKNTS